MSKLTPQGLFCYPKIIMDKLIYPDFDSESLMSQKMFETKMAGDSSFWPRMRETFAHDLKTLPMERFKVWASVWTIPFMSIHRDINYVKIVLDAIGTDPVYAEALLDKGIGMNQDDLEYLSVFKDFPTTMTRVAALAHFIINGWTKEKLASMDTIIELGGGIGDMCDIAYRMGFKGKYVIYDFPEINQIQKWYMNKLGNHNVVCTSDVNDLFDADLLIGAWSFTEMPLELRDRIMEKTSRTKNWLLVYSNYLLGLDNKSYIENVFIPQIQQYTDVKRTDIPFLPWDGGHVYLSATQKVSSTGTQFFQYKS